MKKQVLFIVVTLIVGFFYISNPALIAQESESGFEFTDTWLLTPEVEKIAQEKLENAMIVLKKEIKLEVKVANGGTITGIVRCKRVRTSENVVVYIERVGDNNYPAPLEHGAMEQWNLTFVPHVMAVQRNTIVDFPNSDSVRHNVFSPPYCCKQFNLGTYDVGVGQRVTFDKSCEIPLLCNIHAEMSAFVLVLDNPYFSVTGKEGVYKIENVPPGKYRLNAWHEKLETETKDFEIKAGTTTNVNFALTKKK